MKRQVQFIVVHEEFLPDTKEGFLKRLIALERQNFIHYICAPSGDMKGLRDEASNNPSDDLNIRQCLHVLFLYNNPAKGFFNELLADLSLDKHEENLNRLMEQHPKAQLIAVRELYTANLLKTGFNYTELLHN